MEKEISASEFRDLMANAAKEVKNRLSGRASDPEPIRAAAIALTHWPKVLGGHKKEDLEWAMGQVAQHIYPNFDEWPIDTAKHLLFEEATHLFAVSCVLPMRTPELQRGLELCTEIAGVFTEHLERGRLK